MASTLGGILQTTFATVSFSAAICLFRYFDKNSYEVEIRRHNHAPEDLAKSKELFYENEVKQHDRIQKLRQHLQDANIDLNDTNKSLDLFKTSSVYSV